MRKECNGCKYLSTSKSFCLLGRLEESCKSRKARRGDESLIERFKTISVQEYRAS